MTLLVDMVGVFSLFWFHPLLFSNSTHLFPLNQRGGSHVSASLGFKTAVHKPMGDVMEGLFTIYILSMINLTFPYLTSLKSDIFDGLLLNSILSHVK